MSSDLRSLELQAEVSKRTQKFSLFWSRSRLLGYQSKASMLVNIETSVQDSQADQNRLDLQGFNSAPPSLASERGFAQTFFISLLPILLAGFLVVLFSQFFLKNWMQSLHICRTELLHSQKKASIPLKNLLELNKLAKSLRIALAMAKAQLALAIATKNPGLAAKAIADITRIEGQRRQLGLLQKTLILQANGEMARGLTAAVSKIRRQSSSLQSRLPDFLAYRIHTIRPVPAVLAVKPDRPDVAPVYELLPEFTRRQALHISWISQFQTRKQEQHKWIRNHHRKYDSCGASLDPSGKGFQEVLHGDKSSLKL